ncbi:uncharacterized WD repeat-containing protein alr2800-like [Sycon ciliatum]|uniref:uncharacterized WD repeat-containing protein alr2800-like n=1 Tax=Sycon ciliatum TaxID=27933 RepID=UPI0031F695F3
MGQGSSGTPKSGRRGSGVPQIAPVTICGDLSLSFAEHKQPVLCCGFSADEKLLVTGSADTKVIVWSLSNAKPIAKLVGHSNDVTGCAFIGSVAVVTTSKDGCALVWQCKTWSVSKRYSNHESSVLACAVSHDQQHIATGSEDKTAHVWASERHSGPPGSLLRGHTGPVVDVCFSPDDVAVGTCSSDCTIRLWNRRSGRMITELKDPLGPCSVAYSPDGIYLCVASKDSMVRIWNVNSEEVVNSLGGHSDHVTGCDFNSSGTVMASCSKDTHGRLWNPRSVGGKAVKVLAGHTAEILACTFSPSGQYLATVSKDNTCRVWK